MLEVARARRGRARVPRKAAGAISLSARGRTTGVLGVIRGTLTFAAIAINTVFWAIPIYAGVLLKLVLPRGTLRDALRRALIGMADNWVSVNGGIFALAGLTQWKFTGLERLRRNGRYLVVANHQSWADILVLQRTFNRRIPFLKFFIKQELIWVPVLGLAWWGLEFPFMKRYSSEYLAKHPELRGRDLETTRRMCESLGGQPLTIMNFLEGTRFAPDKRDHQKSPYHRLLKPKAGGIAFVLGTIGASLDALLDVTIVYRGQVCSFWDFLCGRIDAIEVDVVMREIPPDLVARDYYGDAAFRESIQGWIRDLWAQKDSKLEAAVRVLVLAVSLVAYAATASVAADVGPRPNDPERAVQYDAALADYENGRHGQARVAFEVLAKAGVPQAAFMLGVLYEYGDGVAPSYGDAAAWYRAAADAGLTSAETRLGILHLEGKGVAPDPAQARVWLERAARKRDPLAFRALGDMHARGQGVTQSIEDAYAYYLLADAEGDAEAAARLNDLERDLSPGRREHARARARAIVERLTGATNARSTAAADAGRARPTGDMVLRTQSIREPKLGGNAMHVFVPTGWSVRGSIEWRSEVAFPAMVVVSVENDDGVALTTLPKRMYAWHFEAGDEKKPFLSRRGYESRPPVGDAVVYIERIVIPEQRGLRGAQILDRQPLPAVSRVVAADLAQRGMRADVSAARVRISYVADERDLEADVFAVLKQVRDTDFGGEVILWGAEHLYLYRAPAGTLDRHAALLDAIAASLRFDDAWWSRYEGLLAALADRPGRSQISEREFEMFLTSAEGSRPGRSPSASTREARRARFHASMASELGRTEIFFDPRTDREIAFPKGYARIWAGRLGQYRAIVDPREDLSRAEPTAEWVELHAVSTR
jgi:TPR repeat protein